MVGLWGCDLGVERGTWEAEERRAMNWSESSMVRWGRGEGGGGDFERPQGRVGNGVRG